MKTCPKCGKENSDNYIYCQKCGTMLDKGLSTPLDPQQSTRKGRISEFRLLGENLSPAEGEIEVRAYHCTSFKSQLLNLNAEGYLVATNKRVIFHADGSSFAGKSILQSEIPIEDVSGITIYKGSYLSFLHLFGAFIFSVFVGGLVNSILASITISILRSIMQQGQSSLNPDTLKSSVEAAQNWGTVLQVLLWVLAIAFLVGSFFFSKDKIFRSALAATSAILFAEVGGMSYLIDSLQNVFNNSQGTGTPSIGIFIGLIVGIYALVCIFWYARRPTMSLAVGSKGGSSTPIAISGISSFGLYTTSASKALSAEPAEDAESLVKELGALIMDIQDLGDEGIKLWYQG